MDYILVEFSCGNISSDLKIPAFASVSELIEVFNDLYGKDGTMLHAEPRGIILDKHKTLAEQNVGHGAKLTLYLE